MTLRGTDGGRGATQEGSMGVRVALTSGDLRRTSLNHLARPKNLRHFEMVSISDCSMRWIKANLGERGGDAG